MNHLSVFITLVLLFASTAEDRAQSFITIDGSQVFSNFKFTDSDGKVDNDYTSITSGGYSLGYRAYQRPSRTRAAKRFGALFVRANVGMRKGGATLPDVSGDITWNLQYCDLRLGFGYEVDKWRIKPYVSVAPYYSILLKGYQNMDGANYDIKKNKTIKTTDIGLLVIPGVKAHISDYISLYLEFSVLKGLQNLEPKSQQKLYNKGYFLTLGLAATLTKSKPKWVQGRR